MNNMRRKEIEETMKELSILANKLAEVVETINRINEDEEEYRDNVPENLQESDRYYASEEASCSMHYIFFSSLAALIGWMPHITSI